MADRNLVLRIPALLGEENFEDWNSTLKKTLELSGLIEYISDQNFDHLLRRGVAEATAFYANRVYVLGIILDSVRPVLQQLVEAGWDIKKADQHPRDLYQLIERVFKPVNLERGRLIARCLRQLHTKPRGISLGEFRTTIVRAKRYLRENDAPISNTLALWAVLDALEGEYPEWHRQLVRDKDARKLTWAKLLERMEVKARENLNLINGYGVQDLV